LELYQKWKIDPVKGNLAFGSAYHNWAYSVDCAKQKIMFSTVYELCKEQKVRELAHLVPLHKILLREVIRTIDNPLISQKIKFST
jgi:elongation factor 2